MANPSVEQLHSLLKAAIRDAPVVEYGSAQTAEEVMWLGRCEALLDAAGYTLALVQFNTARSLLGTMRHDRNDLLVPLHTAFYRLELQLPLAAQGTFIAGGDSWNGFAGLAKLLQPSCADQFMIDPYIDASFFLDFVPISGAQHIRCLTVNRPQYAQGLEAAARRWGVSEQAKQVTVELRYAEPRELHDRLIVVDGTAWLVSQSFKDIGAKSSASLQLADPDLSQAKVVHYAEVWARAEKPDLT